MREDLQDGEGLRFGDHHPPHIYFCFVDYTKAFDCVNHNKLWKILQEIGLPDHLTCLLRNLCAGQEATGKNERGKTVCQPGRIC